MARIENNLAEMFNKHNSMPQVKKYIKDLIRPQKSCLLAPSKKCIKDLLRLQKSCLLVPSKKYIKDLIRLQKSCLHLQY